MKPENFNDFVTMASEGPSIESPHGTVHVCVGGAYGHMSMLSYSAFDPILYVITPTPNAGLLQQPTHLLY
jgi:tyrosinase